MSGTWKLKGVALGEMGYRSSLYSIRRRGKKFQITMLERLDDSDIASRLKIVLCITVSDLVTQVKRSFSIS